MDDFYTILNLKRSASSKKLFRKLEKIIRQEIADGKDIDLSLKAFLILSNESFRKYYDKVLLKPKLLSRLARSLNLTANSYVSEVKQGNPETKFTERAFVKAHCHSIFLSTFSLDYLIYGVETGDPSFQQSNYLFSKTGQMAFTVSNLFYFGIPILLGVINSILWWTLIPFVLYKGHKEYWRIKFDYYFDHEKNKTLSNRNYIS